jgi:hypothetical protein
MDFKLFDTSGLDTLAKDIGAPTFEEFARAPHLYRQAHDEIMQHVSHGSDNLRRHVDGYEYEYGLLKTKKLEKIEQAVLDSGYKLSDLDIKPHVEQSGRGKQKYKIIVKFVIKEDKKNAIVG